MCLYFIKCDCHKYILLIKKLESKIFKLESELYNEKNNNINKLNEIISELKLVFE